MLHRFGSVLRCSPLSCQALHLAAVPSGRPVSVAARVARWHIFKPKIQIWVNFRGTCNGRCWRIWSILRPFRIYFGLFGIFYGNAVYFTAFWYVVPIKIWQPWPNFGAKSAGPATPTVP
jgi:hypothetical protein